MNADENPPRTVASIIHEIIHVRYQAGLFELSGGLVAIVTDEYGSIYRQEDFAKIQDILVDDPAADRGNHSGRPPDARSSGRNPAGKIRPG